jgi:hypothetical protein
MSSQHNKSINQQIDEFYDDFIKQEVIGETDDDIANAILDLALKIERARHRVTVGSLEAETIDEQTIEKMTTWDSDNPDMSTLEKVFRRIAKGRGLEGVDLLKKAIRSKAQAVSDLQRERAQTPRPQHPVDKLIEQIISERPEATAKEVLREIEANIGKGLIFNVDDETITPADEKYMDVSISGVPDRITRIKKKIAKAG